MSQKTARRLVVTGHDAQGRSRVASDSRIEGDEIPGNGGMEINQIWGADGILSYPDGGSKPPYTSFFPPLGGCRVIEFYLPGKVVEYDDAAESAEAIEELLPGHAATRDNDRPGMHRSATIDMGIVIEGRIVLQLDDGEVTLGAGDMIVQSGTMHAWCNPFDEPCRLVGFMAGARIEPDR